jgi:branched-chain amino acid transport system substrate-binding protein
LIGSITADQTILSEPDLPTDYLRGAIGSGPTADDFAHPTWKAFVENYRKTYPDALNFPSFFSTFYYLNTKAVLLALQASEGDFSTTRFKAELDTLQFEGPCGPVRLDHHRQAIANVFVTEVARNRRGVAYRKLVQVIESVNQTLGLPEEDYLAMGSFSRDNPSCP